MLRLRLLDSLRMNRSKCIKSEQYKHVNIKRDHPVQKTIKKIQPSPTVSFRSRSVYHQGRGVHNIDCRT